MWAHLSLFLSLFLLSFLSLHSSFVECAQYNDPQYGSSWHLHSTVDVPVGHVNVEPVWDMGVTGNGVMIAFSSRTPFLHNEFTRRFAADSSSVSLSDVPSASKTSHIALAVGNANNNVCSVGVAHKATFSVINSQPENALHFKWMNEYKTSLAQVLVIDYTSQDGTNTQCSECWDSVHTALSRNQVVVAATGTGGPAEDCNRDMYSNIPLTIAVAPHTSAGEASVYAERCSNALVSAPGGSQSKLLLTAINGTDVCGGVSSGLVSAPIVAGVVALMLEASGNSLSHRQVSHILVETASFPDMAIAESTRNGAGFRVHPVLGFGMVNAEKAVKAAARQISYTAIREIQPITYSAIGLPQVISDVGKLELSAPINENSEILVDWVSVEADIDHSHASDLEITLTSPIGTKSVLYSAHTKEVESEEIYLQVNTTATHSLGLHQITPLNKAARTPVKIGQVRFHLLDCCSERYCSVTKDKGNTHLAFIISHKNKQCTTQTAVSMAVAKAHSVQRPISIVILDEVINADSISITVPVVALDEHTFAGVHNKHQEGKSFFLSLLRQRTKPKVSLAHWKFSTTHNWGERAMGNWRLSLEDKVAGDSGRVNSATFVFHSYKASESTIAPFAFPPPSNTPTYSPTSYPRPSLPTPTHHTHTPSPKASRNCCVYLSSADYVTKNCVAFNMECPDLDNWILSSVEAGVENCKSRCSSPLPSPTPVSVVVPTPVPKAGVNFQCCWYLSSEQKKNCYRFAVDVCPNIPNMTPVGEFPSAGPNDCNEFCEQ